MQPGPYRGIILNPNYNYAEPRLATRLTGLKVNFEVVDEYSNKVPFDDFIAKSILVELINTNSERIKDVVVMEPGSSPNGVIYRLKMINFFKILRLILISTSNL